MFDFIWRWLDGWSPFRSSRQARGKVEPIGPQTEREWLAAQRKRLITHFAAAINDADPRAEWMLAPHVVVWSIAKGWAISGVPPFDHVVGNDAIGSARDAARYFARRYRERSRRLAPRGPSDESQALARWAEVLMTSVRSDDGWPEELPGGETVAARAEELLAGPLFRPHTDPDLGSVLRIVCRRKPAPGGDQYGIYFYLDLSGKPTVPVFDALARRIIDIDGQFAPLVAYRVQYALVYFGINFGNATKETEVKRLGDEMRARYPELSRRIDDYATKDGNELPIHFVDASDRAFTAYACMIREAGKPYIAEAKYFNCRDQPLHKQMEASSDVALRLVAASIDPDVIAEARRAFVRSW